MPRRNAIEGPQETFMTKRMLIDAAHPEETRVVIVDGTRVEELDFESHNKRQLRGNVYLAKVTRVEPSLQAAFIDYGGNRHGFLAFSEIHPDYYQIPYEDKLALQQQEEEDLSDETDDDDDVEEDENLDPDENDASDENDAEVADEQVKVASRRRKQIRRRRYKIQEVIKRGQILLVQAVKEERGNKGAAMTTYLSLAGRYCVLMPNTPRGGGISRKIANGSDRKRLKSVMDDLDVPQGMGVIVRTAGAKRTKAEIKRDYDYLSRLWDDIRDLTLKSVAPALIHEEGNLVKRSIRDLYNKEIEEVLVQGEDAYKTAKSFIKMLMPSHAKFVKRYDDMIPLFLRYDVERQIENSLDAVVQLKSGGYLVIHPTEALVSVDVNSGKSTKERNVERTALKTNLEAAEELARQMRLRDLAGLIVVDFIDMDENKNNRAVERKMKEVLARDRARIQTGRISQFGLMEMSRQRRRRSLLEGSTAVCKHCDGVGRKRTVESAALAAIRAVEEFAIRGKARKIRLKCPPDVALYLLNEKRDLLTKVDENADVFTIIEHDDDLIRPAFTLEVAEKRKDGRKDPLIDIEKEIQAETKKSEADRKRQSSRARDDEDDDANEASETETSDASDDKDESKPRRRRGRRGGRNRNRKTNESENDNRSDDGDSSDSKSEPTSDDEQDETPKPKRRRRRASSKSKDQAKDDVASSSESSETSADADADDQDKSSKGRKSAGRRKAPSRDKTNASDKSNSDGEEAPSEAREDKAEKAAASSRRRKAPSRQAKAQTDGDKPSEKDDATTSGRRRSAPKRKPAQSEDGSADDKPKPRRRSRKKTATGNSSTDEAKSEGAKGSSPKAGSRRRKAPTKDQAAPKSDDPKDRVTDEGEAEKPARRRRAPSKATKKATAPEADEAVKAEKAEDDKPAAKPARRRRAPSKSEEDVAAKPARKRPAPKRKPASASDEPDAEVPKRKPATRRKSPAKKAVDDTPKVTAPDANKATSPAEKPAARTRRAPARKSAPKPDEASKPAPKEEPKPETATGSDSSETSENPRRRKAPPKRKRGLIDRLMGKE
jgi:ribonuclease E